MISRTIIQKAALLLLVGLLSSCAAPTPQVGEIQAQKGTTITVGDEANLNIPVSGEELKFEWTALKGTIETSAQSAAIYKAPDTPGSDTVTVRVIYSDGEVIRHITFEVIAPPPPTATETPPPADTPIPTPTLEPVACNIPPVTGNLFPQLANVDGQYPIHGPIEGTDAQYITCEAVSDIVHEQTMSVHFKYEQVGQNSGWWGIATPNGYDASDHNQLCFWAYAKQQFQSFRVKMKDISKNEAGPVVTIGTVNNWEQICTDIEEFRALGINTEKMDNVNLGFEAPLGSAEIWVAEFEFK